MTFAKIQMFRQTNRNARVSVTLLIFALPKSAVCSFPVCWMDGGIEQQYLYFVAEKDAIALEMLLNIAKTNSNKE